MLALSAPEGETRVLFGMFPTAILAKTSLLTCRLDRRRVDSIFVARMLSSEWETAASAALRQSAETSNECAADRAAPLAIT